MQERERERERNEMKDQGSKVLNSLSVFSVPSCLRGLIFLSFFSVVPRMLQAKECV